MDAFKYQAAVHQLYNAKYVKDLEELVRKWHDAYVSLNWYGEIDYKRYKFTYKLYTLALKLFSKKSVKKLPEFLYKDNIQAQMYILSKIYSDSDQFTFLQEYSEFIDIFEFNNIVNTPKYRSIDLTPLHNIVLDKPLHFKFKFNQSLDSFENYSTDVISRDIKFYIQAIRLKQVLSPNKPATVLEQYLDFTKSQITEYKDASADILKLKQHVKALETYQKEFINGQS